MANHDSRYTPELADDILEKLAEGLSLTDVARAVGLPRSTIALWRDTDRDGFAVRYARAREEGIHARFERIRELTAAEENVQRARLIFDQERWELSKLLPKVYGDKLELSGEVGLSKTTDEQIDARLTALMARATPPPAA